MMVTVEPYVCNDCQELTDVQVGLRGKVYQREKLTAKQKKEFYRCGMCQSDRISKWDTEKKPCPKCGNSLDRDESESILWD
jgi:protein-arginine kinase activator protein McsA